MGALQFLVGKLVPHHSDAKISVPRQTGAILRVSFRRVSQNHKNAAAIKLLGQTKHSKEDKLRSKKESCERRTIGR